MLTEIQDGDAIFSTALELNSAQEREAYIQSACGNDAELRRQVEERVAAHFQAKSMSNKSADAVDETLLPNRDTQRDGESHADGKEGPGTRIGAYKLVKQLGESRTSTVFLAEQKEPMRRQVALKIIKTGHDKNGHDERQAIARLEAERQVLTQLKHPHIVELFDSGTTPYTGRPYLAMELVKGIPITVYCNEHRLSLRQRLVLFVSVCQAVQYVHQKGVIHYNLKPSNVLVDSSTGKPVPKVLDFGAAGEARRRAIDSIPVPNMGDLADTLEYLSPEQADIETQDVDSRSDVYSLGALLYELLTGTTPVERERLKHAEIGDALRLICQEEVPQPSKRLRESSKATLASMASQRHMEPAALIAAIQGELDAVTMKALDKNRIHRYQTANELARDVQCFLAGDPVEAYSSRAAYRLRKWARKYPRVSVIATATLLLLVAIAIAGAVLTVRALRMEQQTRTAVQHAEEERDRANKEAKEFKRQLEVAQAARQRADDDRDRELAVERAAQRSAEDTKAVLAFLQDRMLSVGRPKGWAGGQWAEGWGKSVTLLDAVNMAESKVADVFADRPLAEASIREMLGSTYLDLGEAATAVKQFERALALRDAMLGPDHSETAACRNKLAVAYRLAGRSDEASQLYDQNVDSPSHAAALAIQGSMLLAQKKYAEAELKLRERLDICQKIQPDDWTTFDAKAMLGEAFMVQKKYNEAEPLLIAGYEGMKKREAKLSPDAKARLTKTLERLVQLYDIEGKKDKAAQWRKTLEAAKAAKKS